MKIKRNETYGSFIKRIRQTAKLTQADFAIAVGVGANSISQWENGKYEPNFVSKRAIDEFARKIKE
jgi:transcriptional regulator with XRE-family HTH domain